MTDRNDLIGPGKDFGIDNGRTNESGLASIPTKKAWEKLMVASVASVAPKRSNENDCTSIICCLVGANEKSNMYACKTGTSVENAIKLAE